MEIFIESTVVSILRGWRAAAVASAVAVVPLTQGERVSSTAAEEEAKKSEQRQSEYHHYAHW